MCKSHCKFHLISHLCSLNFPLTSCAVAQMIKGVAPCEPRRRVYVHARRVYVHAHMFFHHLLQRGTTFVASRLLPLRPKHFVNRIYSTEFALNSILKGLTPIMKGGKNVYSRVALPESLLYTLRRRNPSPWYGLHFYKEDNFSRNFPLVSESLLKWGYS